MTTRRNLLKRVATGVLTLGLSLLTAHPVLAQSPSPTNPPRVKKPNMLFILADDLGIDAVGCYGAKKFSTPNIDRLAATGIRFENAHVQPLCTPTRVQLLTGCYNVRNYVQFAYLDPEQTTFANLLQKAGYATCIAGKWQLHGGLEAPRHFGFDEYCLWQLTRKPERYRNPGLEINGKQVDYTRGEYGPDIVSDYVCDFMERKSAENKPFLAYYPMILPHFPNEPTPDSPDYGHTDPTRDHFPEMVAYMDKMVGKVVHKLETLGIRDNTLVVFLGDNGTATHGKAQPTDFGTHVPLVANWPGVVSEGRVLPELVDSTDIFPTLCAVTQTPIPETLTLDGHSLWPQLQGEKGTPREWTYTWYGPRGGPSAQAEFARTKLYKLTRRGQFIYLGPNGNREYPVSPEKITPEQESIRTMLQGVLDKYREARPAKLRAMKPVDGDEQ